MDDVNNSHFKPENYSAAEIKALIQDLRVHEVELNAQNEHLRVAHDQLMQLSEKYSLLFNFAPVGLCSLNFKGMIIDCNQQLADLLEIQKELLVNQSLGAFVFKDEISVFMYLLDRPDKSVKHNLKLITLKQNLLFCDVSVTQVSEDSFDEEQPSWIVAFNDVTQLHQVSEELSIKSQAIDSSSEGIVILSDDGCIEFANQGFLSMSGLTQDYMYGKSAFTLFSDILHENFTRESWKGILLKEKWNGRGSLKRQSGSSLDVLLSLNAIHDENNSIKNYMLIISDISMEVKLQSELERSNLELENKVAERTEQYRLAQEDADNANLEKSRFLANMSHELRTPMHAILSFSNLALKRDIDEKTTRYLQNIRTSGIRLTTLLNDLLDLSKLEAGKLIADFHCQDIVNLIHQAITEVSSLLNDKNIAVNIDAGNHVDAFIDQKLFIQVIVNLLSNAIKFSDENTLIDININRFKDDSGQETIQVEVIDSGIGIPESELEDVFDKFVQSSKTHSKSGGTGLGLAISKEIIELHRGKIWAESPVFDDNKGSAFKISIPAPQLPSVGEMKNIDKAIDMHLQWKRSIEEIFLNDEISTEISVPIISNDHLCTLGQWIDNNQLDDETHRELLEKHRNFHVLAGEYVAYFQMKNYHEASSVYHQFNKVSDELIELIRHVGMTHY